MLHEKTDPGQAMCGHLCGPVTWALLSLLSQRTLVGGIKNAYLTHHQSLAPLAGAQVKEPLVKEWDH